jgi:hypothetical protein
MRTFASLETPERGRIQNERINTILLLDNEFLNQFLSVESLNYYPVEVPPILFSIEDLNLALVHTNSGDLGKLQRFYFQTYINSGSVHFCKNDEESCRMIIKFNKHPRNVNLTNEKSEIAIDGNNGLAMAWVVQIVKTTDLLTSIDKSLNIIIKVDGIESFRKPIHTLISQYQVNSSVALINLIYTEFKELKIIIESVNNVNFDFILTYH